MHLTSKLCTALLFASLALGCGGGGVSDFPQTVGDRAADLKASDLSGTWTLTARVASGDCGNNGSTATTIVTIVVSGTTVTIAEAGQSNVVLTLKGSRVQGTSSETVGTVRLDATWDLSAIGGKIDGTVTVRNVTIANGQLSCTETQALTGYRSSLLPVASLVGNWKATLTNAFISGNCSNEIGGTETADIKIELGSGGALQLTLGSTPFTTSVVGNRLQGTKTLNGGTLSFDIGVVDATTFEGTFTAVVDIVGACTVIQGGIGKRV